MSGSTGEQLLAVLVCYESKYYIVVDGYINFIQ
jgi:hypothetical protein